MTLRSRTLSLVVALLLSAVASVMALPATPASAVDTSDDCVVGYQLVSGWSTGFYGLVTLANVGDVASTGWEVTLDFPNGQIIQHPDPIRIPPQPGEPTNPVRIRNASWNGVLQPGASVMFPVIGTHNGVNNPPAVSCVLFV